MNDANGFARNDWLSLQFLFQNLIFQATWKTTSLRHASFLAIVKAAASAILLVLYFDWSKYVVEQPRQPTFMELQKSEKIHVFCLCVSVFQRVPY